MTKRGTVSRWLTVFAVCGLMTACGDGGSANPEDEGSPSAADAAAADSTAPGGEDDAGPTPADDPDAAVPDEPLPDAAAPGGDPIPVPSMGPMAEVSGAMTDDGSTEAMMALFGAFESVAALDDRDFFTNKTRRTQCPEISRAGSGEGWRLDYGTFGCVNSRGKFARGEVYVTRTRERGTPLVEMRFEGHRRGLTARSPVLDGVVRAVKEEDRLYRVENDPEAELSVRVAGHAYTTTIDGLTVALGREVEIQGAVRFEDARGSERSRVAETALADGTPAPLVYNLPDLGECGCPQSGALTVSGDGFFGEHEGKVTVSYQDQSRDQCGPSNVAVEVDGEVWDPVDLRNPGGLSDLQAVRSLCLGDRARKYDCLTPSDAAGGGCSEIAGVYQMSPGEARFFVQGESVWPERLPNGDEMPHSYSNVLAGAQGRHPLDLCSEMVDAMGERLASSAMTLHVAGNCAVSLYAQPWARGEDGGGLVTGVCGRMQDRGQGYWDLVQEGLGIEEHDDGFARVFFGDRVSEDDSVILEMLPTSDRAVIRVSNALDADGEYGDTAVACDRSVGNDAHDRNSFRSCLAGKPWKGIEGIWEYIDSLRSCGASARERLAGSIAGLDGNTEDGPDSIRIDLPIIDLGVFSMLQKLLMNSDEFTHLLSEDFRPQGRAEGRTQEYVFAMQRNREDCHDRRCLSVPGEDEVDWKEAAHIDDGVVLTTNLPEPDRQGRRLWLLVNGRVKVHMPSLQDLADACGDYADACHLVTSNPSWQSMDNYRTDPDCGELAGFCGTLQTLADDFDNFDWTQDLLGVEYDPAQCYPNVPFRIDDPTHPDNGKMCVLGALKLMYENLPAWMTDDRGDPDDIVYDFARAVIVDSDPNHSVPDDLEIEIGYEDDNNRTVNRVLSPHPVRTELGAWVDQNIVRASLRYEDLHASNIRTYAVSSETEPSPYAWQPQKPYRWRASGPLDFPVFDSAAAEIVSPTELNVCHPREVILDNVYFPTIRWDGYYRTPEIHDFVQWLAEVRNADWPRQQGNIQFDGFTNFWEANSGHMGEYIKEVGDDDGRLHTASLYLTTSNIADLGGFWGPRCPLCGNFNGKNDVRVVPDAGLFTESYMGWFELAPAGRNYMEHPQPIVDYMFHVVVTRSSKKYLDASEMYGGWVEEDTASDGVMMLSVDLEYKPIIVINSDLFPGGNFTHFWRRDIYGAMMNNPCE